MSFIQFFSYQQQHFCEVGGARRDRTADLLRARQALSQLSYGPLACLFSVGGVAVFVQSVTHNVCALSFAQPAPCQSKKILRQLAMSIADAVFNFLFE